MGDLISGNNEFIVKSNHMLRELNISSLDIFRLNSVIDALPVEWRESLNTFASTADEPFNLHNEIKLSFNNKNVLIETVVSKTVYKELRNRIITPPTAQLNLIPILLMKSLPSIKVFNSKIKMIHQLETIIAKSNNKLKAHNMKWGKYKNN